MSTTTKTSLHVTEQVTGAVSQGHGDKRYTFYVYERIYRLASILAKFCHATTGWHFT